MKIVVVGPVYPFRGGIAHSNTMLCSNLSKNHDVVAISFKRLYPKLLFPGKAQKYEEKRKFDIKVEHIIDSLNPFNWFKVFLRVKEIKPDLVILQWWTIFLAPFSFTLLGLLKIFTPAKKCVLVHHVFQNERRTFDYFITKSVLKKADYFVAFSSKVLNDVKEMIPKAKVRLLLGLASDQFFDSKAISKEEAKKKLRLKGNVVLFFGFVRKYKGLQYLLDAMPTILKKFPITLLVVGEFWEGKNDYINQIERHKIGNFVKIIDKYIPDDEVHIYFSASDVLILPYTAANQSAILQTAFGFDKPAIVSNVGGLGDVVEHNKTGMLIPSMNSGKLASAVIDFYKNKKEKKFAENIKKKKKIFEWNKSKEKVLFHGM